MTDYFATESARPVDWRGPETERIDMLIASGRDFELRLVGALLPTFAACIEHCVVCVCQSFPFRDAPSCDVCNDTGYSSREVCIEGDCRECDRLHSICQPGHEMEWCGGSR